MIEPIKLDVIGQMLVPAAKRWRDPDNEAAGLEELTENSALRLNEYIGKHERCGGSMFLKNIAKGFNVLLCGPCRFRMYVPESACTFRQLREFCKHAAEHHNHAERLMIGLIGVQLDPLRQRK